MAFTVTTRTSQTAVAATGHTVTLPDGSNVSGVRVVVLFGAPTSAITWPAGWTGFFDGSTSDTRLGVAYRDIDGTEGFDGVDDTITVQTGESVLANAHAYLISAGHDAATAPEAATAATGIGANADAPSLNPAGWDVEEALWIAVAGYRFNASFSAAPTDYTGLLSLSGDDANTPLGSARRVLPAASEDPGAFTSSDGANWVATTVAVRPAAGGAVDGTASGSFGYSGTASGQATAIGSSSGSYAYSGTASGQATAVGSAAGSYGYAGTAVGAGVAPPMYISVTVGPMREPLLVGTMRDPLQAGAMSGVEPVTVGALRDTTPTVGVLRDDSSPTVGVLRDPLTVATMRDPLQVDELRE